MKSIFGNPITDSSIPYTLIFYPITGNIKKNDIIAIFVGDENRTPISRINTHPQNTESLFACINISTKGTESYPEKITSIKVFHYVNEIEGYVTEIKDISDNFNKLIQGSNNTNSPIPLDVP